MEGCFSSTEWLYLVQQSTTINISSNLQYLINSLLKSMLKSSQILSRIENDYNNLIRDAFMYFCI